MNLISDLLTLDRDSLAAPESRVDSITGARNRIKEMRDGDKARAVKRNTVQAIIDGNAPNTQEEMDRAGRGEDANINWREGEGMVAAATTPYYELDFGVNRAANIDLRYGDNKQKWFEWSETISNLYSETLWSWKGYRLNRQISHYQMVVHNVGPIMWPSKRGWHFSSKTAGSVLVADDATCDLDLLPEMAIPDHFEPTQLFRLIDKAPDNSGWNKTLAKRAIVNAAPKDFTDLYGDSWGQYQSSLRRGDVWWSNREARIYYTHYLAKEFDGTITHCLVLDTQPDEGNGQTGEDDFLFKKQSRFDGFDQIVNPFFFEIGPDGLWHSGKGLGPKIFDTCDASNRFRNTLLNAAMTTSGMTLQAQNNNALQKIQQTPIVRASGVTFLPPPNDWAIPTNPFRVDLRPALEVLREIQGTNQSNTGQYRQRVAEENQEPTLGQAQLNVQQQMSLSRGAYDRYYHFSDDMHFEVLRRMLDPDISKDDAGGQEAIDFREYCLKEGVPEEALDMKYVCKVEAQRSVGRGSPQMQQMVGQQLVQLLPTMSPRGQRNALRMNAAPMVGQSHVDAIYEPFDEASVPDDHQWAASIENTMLQQQGDQPQITPSQNPVIHAESHIQSAVQHVKAVQGGQGDPVGLITHLDNYGPHNHQHIESLAGDPTRKKEYESLTKMHMSLAKVADDMKAQVAQAQAQQQNTPPAPDPAMVTSLLKLHGEMKLKEVKQQADDQRKDQKLQADLHRKDLTAASNIMRKNGETNGTPMPQSSPQKISESLSYKDAPDSIKRQMEAQAGFVPAYNEPSPKPQPAGAQ